MPPCLFCSRRVIELQLKWTNTYENEGFWEPDHSGLFLLLDKPFFFFRKRSTLVCFSFDESGLGPIWFPEGSRKTALPSCWLVLDEPHKQIVCSEESSFHLNPFCWETADSEASRLFLRQEEAKRQKLVDGDFLFGEYTIKHDGSCGFRCFLKDEEQWRCRCQGYLYTDMELYDGNRILFGTAGLGGRFYELDLMSGRKIAEINTKGTNHYTGEGHMRYMFLLGKPGRIAAVNLNSGTIEDSVVLPGAATKDTRIWKYGDLLFATSFLYKCGKPSAAQVSCITLR